MRGPALRAAARIAWRQGRRAPGRSALVLAMIGFPVAALTLGATLIRTSVPTLEEHVAGEMGSAELRVSVPDGVDVGAIEAALPAGSRVAQIRQWNHTEVVDGSLVYATVWEPSIPIDRAPLPGRFVLMDGRAPSRPGEAAVDPAVPEIFGTRVGGDLTIGDRTFRVVGIAAHPPQMWDPLVVVAPGTLPSAREGEEIFGNGLLVDLPRGAGVEAAKQDLIALLRRAGAGAAGAKSEEQAVEETSEAVQTRADVAAFFLDDAQRLTGVSFGATALALLGTGLVAAAAFAVGIRRQLRLLGIVGAAGGEPRHVSAVVLLGGTTLGVAGSLAGVAAGIAGAYAVAGQLPRFTHRLPGAVALHLPTIIGAALLGVAAATAAAARPARIAARVPTLDALASRMPAPRPPGRLARRGLYAAAAGAVLTGATARPGGNQGLLAAGMVLTVGGFLLAVPLLVHLSGRLAPALPAAPRLAVRDTSRHGRRTGTAIAAAAIALTLPVAVGALTLSEEALQRRTRWIDERHLLVGTYLQERGLPETPPALVARVREILPGSTAPAYGPAGLDLRRFHPPPEYAEVGSYPAYVDGPLVTTSGESGASAYRETAQLFIGGPDLLRGLGAADGIGALAAGKVVGIGPGTIDEGRVYLHVFDDRDQRLGNERAGIPLPAVEAGRIRYANQDAIPRYVVAPEHAARLGLVPFQSYAEGTLVAAARALTGEQIARAKDAAAAFPGAYVRTLEDFLPRLGPARAASIGGAALVALGIVAVTVALLASEGRRDQAILVALGAEPRTRRRIAAARAGLVAALAALVAVPAGFVPVAAIQWSRLAPVGPGLPRRYPIVVPWTAMALVALAVPLVAAAFGWAASRAPRASAMLQPVA